MSAAKVELGRHLFYDTRISVNGTQSCETCHVQALAFSDPRKRDVGSLGGRRESMTLVNVAYEAALTWGNPSFTRLEHLMRPFTNQQRVDELRAVPEYQRLFPDAFGTAPNPFIFENVIRALASFDRSIISARSPYDRYHTDRDDTAMSASARRGEALFSGQALSCASCHGGFTFSGAVDFEGRQDSSDSNVFHNIGLYNIAGALSYPAGGLGTYEMTKKPEDVGKFKAPTLRNIALTAPYMHDGSIATLDGVLDLYASGGRMIADGPYRGNGRDNPNKSAMVRGFALTAGEREDLKAFLASLTDEALLHDTRFGNPWPAGRQAPR